MRELVLATNNEHKIREISQIIKNLPIRLLTKKDFQDFPEIEETGDKLEDNAVLKARGIHTYTGFPAMADDSGLEVMALDGAPGVMSARYAGPGCSFRDNNEKLLRELKEVPVDRRQAVFRCVMAICFKPEDVELIEGRVEGFITTEIRGEKGFGYDPVFYLPEYDQTFAEMDPEQKNRISHRALAVQKASEVLRNRFL